MNSQEGFQSFVYYYIIQNFDFTKDYLYTVTYQKNLIYTENGILYNTGYQLNQFLTVKDVTVSSFRRTLNDKKSNVYINIILDRKENVYYRSYMKLDLLIANISAYSSLFYNVFLLICKFLNHKKLSLKLINKFFNKSSEWNKVKIKSLDQLKSKKIRISKYKPQQESVSKFRDEVSEGYREKIVKYVELKKANKIQHQLPLYKFCFFKNNSFEYGDKLLNYQMDIKYIIKRFSDLENLKALFLDKHQLNIFNLLQPKLSIDNDLMKSNVNQFLSDNFLENCTDDQNLDKKLKSLSTLLNSKKDINDKILKLFRILIDYNEEN